MNQIVLEYGTPIRVDRLRMMCGVAFDGCHYYVTIPYECKILKVDSSFQAVSAFVTSRKYDAICYDSKECCFWASASSEGGRLFQLDGKMREIKCLSLHSAGDCACITGLSYHCGCDQLAVSFGKCVVLVCKSTGKCRAVIEVEDGCITNLLSISPVYILTTVQDGKQTLLVYSAEGCPLQAFRLPADTTIQRMVLNACGGCCAPTCLELFLLRKGCKPYFYPLPLNFLCVEEICPCNYAPCQSVCPSPMPPTSPRDSCQDVLESIALMETSLSHILNAEGEKLQKVLATTDDVDAILRTNQSISQTIIHVTHLEQVLYNKLLAIQTGCFCPKLPKPPKPPKPC